MPDRTETTNTSQPASEDAFFVLKDCRQLFQRRLVEIARQSGVMSQSAIEAFSGELGDAHDELVSAVQQDGFDQTAGLTASRITLVGNDDLELEIRIGDIANHLKGNDRIDHWRVQLRYMTLLNRPRMNAENNPVGLEPIRRALWVLCKESGANLDKNLDLLGRLEEMLQLRLPEVYIELNNLLEGHHVEPTQVRVVQRGAGSSTTGNATPGTATGDTTAGTNALSAIQQNLSRQLGGEDLLPADPALGISAGGIGNSTLNASTVVMLNHLMERLSVLEHQQVSGLGTPAGQSPLHAIRSKDLDLPLGKPAAIALDTLSLIFDGIFAAPDLPDAVKAAIGRLQMPLLKLAILDVSFFTDTQHPARRLINRMARAAIGLAQDTGREHPVCVSLGKLADSVRVTLEKNDGELAPHLKELDALIAERDQSILGAAQPYIHLVLDYEAREASSISARNWLNSALAKTAEPAIAGFLSKYWLRVMRAAYLDGGIARARWKECESTIDELIWSVQPKQTPEERKQLMALIPSLIKRINAGLDLLKVPAEERTPFLNACFDLQTAAMRNRPESMLAPAAPQTQVEAEPLAAPLFPGMSSTVAMPDVKLLESAGKLVQYLGRPAEMQSPWRTGGGNAWKDNDWISFVLPDGEHLCGLHCWKGSPSGTVLLFNNVWGYAVALSPAFLEQQLRSGQARVVSEQSIFDEAAERALRHMGSR